MKINIELDMTAEEARRLMGLPDVSALQEEMLDGMRQRMKAAMDRSDPEAMLRASTIRGRSAKDGPRDKFLRRVTSACCG